MKKKGFTLIELLVVIAIIAILAGIVIIAVNPTRQMGQARNAQRRADVLTVLNALHQSYIDNGIFPKGNLTAFPITPYQLGTSTTGCDVACGGWTTAAACFDLSLTGNSDPKFVLVPTYISGIPYDSQGTPEKTSYAVILNAGRITVRACTLEIVTSNIEVTR